MQKIAAFVVSGYAQATFCVSGLAWLAAFIPITGMLSNAALALTALRWGPQRAGVVLILSTLALSGFFFLASLTGLPMAGYESMFLFVLLQWLPVLLIGHLLRTTGSLSFTLNVMFAAGLLVVALAAALVEGRAQLWDQFFKWVMYGASQQQEAGLPDFGEAYQSLLDVMTGIAATSLILVWATSLLLARWWQSLLERPGGFRAEFTGLRLGKAVTVLGLVLFATTSFSEWPLARELLLVAMPGFLLQGIATVHFLLAALKNSQVWLFAFYAALALSPFLPQLPGLLGVLGAAENFVGLRERMKTKPENDENNKENDKENREE